MGEMAAPLSGTGLEFPDPAGQKVGFLAVVIFAAAVLLLAAGFAGWMLAGTLLRRNLDSSSVVESAVWGGGLFMALALAFLVARIRPFSVRDGVVTVRVPVRLATGRRARHVPLTSISNVVLMGPPSADPGILITLDDGTRLSVFEADLPAGGGAFLRRFAGAFGHAASTETGRLERGSSL